MSLHEQLVQQRLACLEPPPAGLFLREPPDAFVVVGSLATDAGDLATLFSGAGTAECIQLTAGRFKGEVRSLRAEAVALSEFTANCGILLRAHVTDGRLLICVPDAAEGILVIENGRLCPPRNAFVVRRRDLNLCTLGDATLTWLDVDLSRLPRTLGRQIDLLLGDDDASIEADPADAAALRDFVRKHLLLTGDARLSSPRMAESDRVEPDAIALLLVLLNRSRRVARTHAVQARLDLVQRAEQFMWDNIEGPLTLEQICATCSCRIRTLIYAFKSQFGLSPMKYFKIRRLNAARRKLRSAVGRARVFDIAADCGFWHMGHFGKDFKGLFGVPPESTMRRSRGRAGLQRGSPAESY